MENQLPEYDRNKVRALKSESIKKVIDALRERPKTYSELKELGIPERSLSRILKEHLEYWGLVEKSEDGRWNWFFRTRKFNSKDEQEIFLNHSQKLTNSLKALLAESELWLQSNALPRDLKNVRKIDEARRWIKYAKEHLQTGYPDIYESVGRLENLESQIRSADQNGRESLNEERVGVYKELEDSITFLIGKIKNGEPLDGYCELCPNVSIKPD